MLNNNEKYDHVETIVSKYLENDNFQLSDEEGEKFIREYLDLSSVMELDPVLRMRFVTICINEIPKLVFKHRGIITAEELNKEIDLYIDSLDPQTKVEFLQLLLKDGNGAIYSRDTAEMLDDLASGINDTNTNWHTVCKHVESIAKEIGLMKAEEVSSSQSVQQHNFQNSGQSFENSTTGTKSQKKKSGCYVATAVYGSYDCPQVWTLRRYRDYSLAPTWYGRLFIALYYAISPTIVEWFGNTDWFNKMWKGRLDKMVKRLQEEGFENTPYDDKNW